MSDNKSNAGPNGQSAHFHELQTEIRSAVQELQEQVGLLREEMQRSRETLSRIALKQTSLKNDSAQIETALSRIENKLGKLPEADCKD